MDSPVILEATSQIKSYMMVQSVFDMLAIGLSMIVIYLVWVWVKPKLHR